MRNIVNTKKDEIERLASQKPVRTQTLRGAVYIRRGENCIRGYCGSLVVLTVKLNAH